jgi:hypothetical protein
MAIRKIPVDMLNATALATHVAAAMGLDVNPKLGVAGIKSKMALAGFPTDFIDYDDGAEEKPIARVEPPRQRYKPGKRMVQLRIEPQEKPGGNEPVFTSVNGVSILIPRATSCWVDFKYYHALQNAVAHIAETDQDSNITGFRKVPEYPVSVFVIEPPLSDEEKELGAKLEHEAAEKRIAARAAEAA